MSNMVITIGRQFGSGGRDIGMELGKALGIKCFDKEIIKMASKENGISEEVFEKVDEKPINSFLYSIVANGFPAYYTPSHMSHALSDDKIFTMQANTIKKIADEMPAIFIGRCADDILRENDKLIKIFIYSNRDFRIKTVCEKYQVSEKEALEMMRRIDKSRSSYYEFFASKKWGDVQNYDLCIDASIGTSNVVEMIKKLIEIKGIKQ